MTNSELLEMAFRDALGLPDDAAVGDLRYSTESGSVWSSLKHMALIGKIEEAFGVILDTEEVIDLSSFAKAGEILTARGVEL